MNKAQVKVLAGLFTLLLVWWLFLHDQRLAATFWNFLTLGIIPGTNNVISMQSLLRLLIGTFTVSFMIIFRTEIIGSFPGRSGQPTRASQPAVMPPTPPLSVLQTALPTITVVPIAPPTKLQPLPAHPSLLRVRIRKYQMWLLRNTQYGAKWADRKMRLTWRYITLLSKRFTTVIVRASIVFAYIIWRVSLRTWRELEPYCRQFDRFLDQKLHRSQKVVTTLEIGTLLWRDAVDAYQRADAYARKLLRN